MVDDQQRMFGVVSLSDILNYLILKPFGEYSAERERENIMPVVSLMVNYVYKDMKFKIRSFILDLDACTSDIRIMC